MQLQAVLDNKGTLVRRIEASATVAEAVANMAVFGIGALMVVDRGRTVGMLTARDVLSRVIAEGRTPMHVRASQIMTRELATAPPSATLEDALGRMNDARCRHLLVMRGSELCGLVSMGDVTRGILRERSALLDDLMFYITHG